MLTAIGHMRPDGQWLPTAVNKQDVLECLNSAVWAPNDGLREPWRFLYVDASLASRAMPEHSSSASAHLVVIAHRRHTKHNQEEDLCAVFGLIQNIRLLLRERGAATQVHIADWMFAKDTQQRLGVTDEECIAAVLDVGFVESFSVNPSVRLNVTLL